MKHGIHGHYVGIKFIKHDIRETTNEYSAIVQMKPGKALRVSEKNLNTRIDTREEFFAETATTFLVPTVSVDEILLGFRGDDQFTHHDVAEPLA